jgi:hypothetical protein
MDRNTDARSALTNRALRLIRAAKTYLTDFIPPLFFALGDQKSCFWAQIQTGNKGGAPELTIPWLIHPGAATRCLPRMA